MIQLPQVSSIKVTTQTLFAFFNLLQSWGEILFRGGGEGCNTLCYGSHNLFVITFIRGSIMH
jgi:hypothetical protein